MMKIIRILFASIAIFFAISIELFSQDLDVNVSGNATINTCETNTYEITIENVSGGDLSDFVIVARLENLTDFDYASGSGELNINGGGYGAIGDPVVTGGYLGSCLAPGAPYLTWDVDVLNGSSVTLTNGQTLSVRFNLETGCNALSGSLNFLVDYDDGGLAECDNTGLLNIQVNSGAATIKKTPSVISEEVGNNVTWTITIENTGYGVIKNVVVTDVLGDGLQYVSCTEGGLNTSQTTTWTSAVYAALASMDPGDILTMDITAEVISCEDLDNVADLRFGCDDGSVCFNTVNDGGRATASVQRIVKTPYIDFNPPDITFDYCEDFVDVNFTISNIGDGTAYEVWNLVDFGALVVSNVSAGCSYNNVENRFELANPIPAGGDYDLSFRLSYPSWCGGSFPTGDLLWRKIYKDGCGNEFYPPTELSQINAPANSTSLNASVSGPGPEIHIGESVTYTITSSHSGSITCGSGTASDVEVVCGVPNGFSVTDADGGSWNPGNRTLSWTFTPPANLSKTVVYDSPGIADCETYCNTLFTTSVTATGVDCCGCDLSATDSESTAIECSEGVTSDKSVSPSSNERCSDVTYTNVYTFDASSTLNLNDLEFTEEADYDQEYVPGSLVVTLNAADKTADAAITDNTPVGGNLILDFSGGGADPLASTTLTIEYDLTLTENTVAACGNRTFYSWSDLDLGFTSGSNCLGDGILHETTQMNAESPEMSVSVSGLNPILHKCESQTITVTLTQTSTYDPKDVKLVLSGLNYYVSNPAATNCSGDVAPTSCEPAVVGGDYEWTFNDDFGAQGDQAVIELVVQKRCGGPGQGLTATAYFDDACNDDASIDEICSVSNTQSPSLMLYGDLIIEMTPEVYYASENQAEWTIYVTNRGTGKAFNVWVDDVLGAGMTYNNAVVSGAATTVTPNQDHDGGAINGCTIAIAEMAAGERREITLTADLIDCANLTNSATASWGCIGTDCQVSVSDNSTVQIPSPNLVNTNVVSPSGALDACSSPEGYITIRNAGQTTCYDIEITETLSSGLEYVGSSTRWRLNGGGWNGPNATYDPSSTVSPLFWTSAEIPGLASIDPGDEIEIDFDMFVSCSFSGGEVRVTTKYDNPCSTSFTTSENRFTSSYNEPDITVTQTRADEPVGCGESITWTIEVTNNSGFELPVIWVEDVMDGAFAYNASVGDGTYCSDNGTSNGQTVTWEIIDLPNNTSATLQLTAATDSSPCSADLDNTVTVWAGCGTADGNSATKPGVDAPDDDICLHSTSFQSVRTETREPDIGYMDIALSPTSIDACNDATEITIVIENSGPTDAVNMDIVITLPDGLSYNGLSSEGCLGTDETCATGAIGEPAQVGDVLTYYNVSNTATNLIDNLEASGGNDTYVLKFSVMSSCFVTDDIGINLRYYDCCGLIQYSTSTNQEITSNYPSLSVSQTPANTTVDCGESLTWTVSVTNNGTGNAQVVRVEETIGDWLDYSGFSSTILGLNSFDMGGGKYGWEFNNLGAGATQEFDFIATLNPDGSPPADCATALRQGSARAIWGCGVGGDATDMDPNSTNYNCSTDSWTNGNTSTARIPDLEVVSVTPGITCDAGDGDFDGSMTVRIRNNGDGNTSSTFKVAISDGSWTGTATTAVLNSGQARNVTIDCSAWNIDCNGCVPYALTAYVDSDDDICECDETDNTLNNNYTPQLADLRVNSITPTCSGDGLMTARVNIENVGCANSSAPFVLRLEDDQGNFDQTTVNSLNSGANTNVDFTNWPSQCSPASINFSATIDYTDTNCECGGSSNTLTFNFNNNFPEMEIVDVTPSATCNGLGGYDGVIEVQIRNNGNGPVTNNFNIHLDDGEGWTADETFTASGGSLPFAQGTIQTASVTWNRAFGAACAFTNIDVEIDDGGAVCECVDANNTASTSYALETPDLSINSVTPSCSGDSDLSIVVSVDNTGCGPASSVVVRLSDNDGQSAEQTIANIAQSASGTTTFNAWPSDGDPATLIFTAEVDPGSLICEISDADNSGSATMTVGNLELVSITPFCSGDSDYDVDLVIENAGTSNIGANFVVRLSDDDGNSRDENFTDIGGTLPIIAGAQQTVTFNNWTTDGSPNPIRFTGTLDVSDNICESASADNTASSTFGLGDLEAISVSASAPCSGDGNINGVIEVRFRNSGETAINNDFTISVDDGEGWSDQLRFNADFGGALPIAPAAEHSVTFSWDRSFTSAPYVCSFAAISAEVDALGGVCESTNSNNTASAAYDAPLPFVRIIDIIPSCIGGGAGYTVDVEVRNDGCSPANNIVIRLSDDDGVSDQRTITLASGANQVLTFAPWPADGDPAILTFTAEVDPANAVCELSPADHTFSQPFVNPNIEITEGISGRVGPGRYNIQFTIRNGGACEVNTDFKIRIQDNQGKVLEPYFTSLGGTLPFNHGTEQTVTYICWTVSGDPYIVDFSLQLDPDGEICESVLDDNFLLHTTIITVPTLTQSAAIALILALLGLGAFYLKRRRGKEMSA